MNKKIKVLIAAGGSGGHIFPAVAVAKKLRDISPDIDILFVGSNKILDRRIFEREGLRFSLLSANKLPYAFSSSIIVFMFLLIYDIIKSVFVVISSRPGVVVGFGGYVSGPVSLAAYIAGVPVIAHEQNVVPGRANKFMFSLAGRIAISFKETESFLGRRIKKAVFTGNPIRPEIQSVSSAKYGKIESLKELGLSPGKFVILVIGGSQGAHFLNKNFIEALNLFDDGVKGSLQVLHITGIKDYEWAVKEYADMRLEHRVYSFIDEIEYAYGASDLVVTRSGASAIFEIAFFSKPMILIPYPFAMSHQRENAMAFSREGAAIEIQEKDLSAQVFKDKILNLLKDRAALARLAAAAKRLSVTDATARLSEEVLNSAKAG